MACSSSSAAAASASNQRNRVAVVNPHMDAPPPHALADAPPPPPPPLPPPPPAGHAVYVEDLYRDPARRAFLRRELPFLCRTVIWALLIFLFIASLSVALWLIFHPAFPLLRVTSATMSAVTVTSTGATAECNITLVLTNPNRHLTTIFDGMQIYLIYPSKQVLLSGNEQPPFVQPRRSRTTIITNLSFNAIDLGSDVLMALKEDLDHGSLSLGIKVVAVMRYRNGKWKTKSQFMRAYCDGVSFGFTSSNKPGIFLNPYQECEVYIYAK